MTALLIVFAYLIITSARRTEGDKNISGIYFLKRWGKRKKNLFFFLSLIRAISLVRIVD